MTDKETLKLLREFLDAEKPGLLSVDVLMVLWLILNGGETDYSNKTLARMFCIREGLTIIRSVKRLEQAGYIAVERHKGFSNVTRLLTISPQV